MRLAHGNHVVSHRSTVRGEVVAHGPYVDVTWRGQQVCSWQECERAEGLEESRETRFKACGQCRRVYYCSKECQRLHWKRTHRHECADLARLPGSP